MNVFLFQLPLALLITGAVIELFAFLWRRSSIRAAARWMILLGTIASVPAATAVWFGLLSPGNTGSASASIPAVLREHALIAFAGIGLLLLGCLIYLGASDRLRRALHLPLLIVVLLGAGMLIFGAITMPPATTDTATAVANRPGSHSIGPMEIHLLLAALAAPLFVVAMGLSFRAAGQPAPRRAMVLHPADSDYAAAFVPHAAIPEDFDEPQPHPRHLPVARLWVIGALLAVVSAGAGAWILARSNNTWRAKPLYHAVVQFDPHHHPAPTRRLAHVLAAIACICLPMILAFAAWLSPRRGFIAAGFGVLLLVAFAAVAWTGYLMTVDTSQGPLTRFNRADQPAVHRPPIQLETADHSTGSRL